MIKGMKQLPYQWMEAVISDMEKLKGKSEWPSKNPVGNK